MDRQTKLQYQQKVEKYLADNHVYDLFQDLLKNIVLKQPTDPVAYMIQKLSENPFKKIFIVGPPGFKVRELALQVADHYKFVTVSVGDLLRKQVSKKQALGQQIESYFKKFTFVKDEIVIQIVKKEIENLQKEKKNFVIEGFPKTRVQALALQRAGILPDAFIIINLDDKKIQQCCYDKFKLSEKLFEKLSQNDKKSLVANHNIEYNLNINQVKQIYKNNYFSIDASSAKQQTVQQMARLLKFKIRPKRPRRSANILISGPPGSGRSTLGRNLAKKYGLVYVSAETLLSDQISRKTEVGRLALNVIKNGQLIGDDIMNGIIHNRVTQIDCHLQGYVLEGFPKTQIQVNSLSDLKILPTLIVVLECDQQSAIERLSHRMVDPETGINYDKYNLAPNSQISKRLIRQTNDEKQIIQKRFKRWRQILKSLQKKYSHIILKVNSAVGSNQVLEKVCFHLQNN